MRALPRPLVLLVALMVVTLASCRREDRPYRPSPATAQSVRWIRMSELQPGPGPNEDPNAKRLIPSGQVPAPYEENAFALSEGKRLFSAYNCAGCHAHGGGDIGPPLKDDRWIYGHEPQQIFSTIVEGRPNGMPSFGARLPEFQVWWLVAYVRSLGGLARKDAAPGREDHMRSSPPENSATTKNPVESSLPKNAEMPQ